MHDKIVSDLGFAFDSVMQELFLVGGSVRDAILGRETHDLDFATDAHPKETRKVLTHFGYPVYDVGEKFGTLGTIIDGVQVEITTYRGEVYTPGSRKPDVRFGSDLKFDLSRRDFTINAIAQDARGGAIKDPFGGREDIAARRIRAVGDAHARFRDDPLRILRAFRFMAQLGFVIEDATLDAAIFEATHLQSISRERIAAELDKLLVGTFAPEALNVMAHNGIMHHVLPELVPLIQLEAKGHKDVWAHTLVVVRQVPARARVRLSALLHDVGKPAARSYEPGRGIHFDGHEDVGADIAVAAMQNLRYSNDSVDAVRTVVRLHMRAGGFEDGHMTDGAVRRLMRDAGDALDDLLDVARADVSSKHESKRQKARERVDSLRARIEQIRAQEDVAKIRPPVDGNELMAAFDRKPGPWLKPILAKLTDLVIDGEMASDDKAGALKVAREMLEG